MEKPEIITQLENEYKYAVESYKKRGEELPYTLDEYIRMECDKRVHHVPIQGGMFKKNYSYAEIKEAEKAIEYLERKQSVNGSKQGSARQLAIAFHFMVLAKHMPKGTLDHSKNAEFLEFLTGKGSENIRKKLGSIKNGEVTGINSEKETRSLINDLKVTRNIFDNVLFEKEVKLIDAYISKLENDLSTMTET